MVKVGDSYSDGRECESQHRILGGHFSHIFGCLKRLKINENDSEVGPF